MPKTLLGELRAIVGKQNVLDRPVDLETYEYDAYLERRPPRAVVFVHSTAEVAAVVKVLARWDIPFVARGFGTNLSGGSLAPPGAVVLELARMNKILAVDVPNQRVTVQTGIFNLDVSTALAPFGYYYAPDPASQKACSLGGNIGENAGGPHCFKYGVTTNHVLALEVVLANGEVVWLGSREAESWGLDLTGVFVGSEGTLGIATTAVLRILHLPEAVKTLLVVCDSLEDGGRAVSALVASGVTPSTLEMIDNPTLNAIEDSLACGFPRDAAAVLLIEVDGLSDGLEDTAEQIARICLDVGAREVRLARDEEERAALWRGRKGAFGAISRLAPNYLVADGTVPRTQLPLALSRVMEVGRRHGLQVANVFHAGDGNLHPLLLFDSRDPDQCRRVVAACMDILQLCADLGGTVSGEHGIGLEKIGAMSLVFMESELAAQRLVKEAFDPWNLANPGKVLPEPSRDCASDWVPGGSGESRSGEDAYRGGGHGAGPPDRAGAGNEDGARGNAELSAAVTAEVTAEGGVRV